MSEAARSRRDESRYEPQGSAPGREAAARGSGPADPLAELARLVGHEDPYRGVFRPSEAGRQRGIDQDAGAPEGAHAQGHLDPGAPDEHELYEDHGSYDGAHDPHEAQAYDDGHDAYAHHAVDDPYAAHGDPQGAAEPAVYADEGGMADQRFAASEAADAIPDLWARGEQGHGDGPEDEAAHHDGGAVSLDRSSARRPLAVLAAVLLLTGGGLAATFLAKGPSVSGGSTAASGRSAPTIMAASGPTKVKVDDGSATAPEDQDAALLSKSGNVSSGPVKIVSSQEQPADLGQLPKSDLAEGARPLPPAAPSPFPEAKKVKTFLVHPDGSMLSPDGGPASAGPATGTVATLPAPADDTPAALPATPRTAARGGTTPKSPAPTNAASAPTIASLTADPVAPDAAAAPAKPARQDAAPGVRTASAKPNDTAAAPSPSGGSFGLQLASSPVESEANAIFARLKKKYPALLGSYTASIHKFETGDKPMYRVRVGGMSQEDAKSLCAKLESAGGSCYVVRN